MSGIKTLFYVADAFIYATTRLKLGPKGLAWATMNPPAVNKSSTRGSGYHQKALAEIRNSLLPFANIGGIGEVGSSAASTISTVSTTSGISSASGLSGLSGASGSTVDKPDQRQALGQLLAMGYSEVRQEENATRSLF